MKMKIEELNEQQTFELAVKSIKNADIKTLKNCLGHARDAKYTKLPIQVDEQGNTLLHYGLMQADREVMKTLMSFEYGFESSYGIKNKAGKTPYQCLLDLPEEKNEFKDIGKRLMGPTWKQSYILDQFRRYLDYQQKNNPEQYSQEDVSKIIKSLESGHCNGLSSIWLQSWLNNEESQYYDLFAPIIEWDKSESSLDEKLSQQFEYAIQLTRTYHMSSQMPELKQFNAEEAKFKASNPTEEQQALLAKSEKFQVSQQNWQTVWGEESYQREVDLKAEISLEGLQEFLKNLATPENEGKGFLFYVGPQTGKGKGSEGHIISAGYRGGKFHIFDSNYTGAESNTGYPVQSFDLNNSKEDILSAAVELRRCIHDRINNEDYDNETFFMGFAALDKKGNSPGKYITFEEAEARALYQSVQEGKPIDPIIFSENIDHLTKSFSQEEMDEFYQRVTFDQNKINEQKYASGDYYTPLFKVVNSHRYYPQAVAALLSSGANPDLVPKYETQTPLCLARNNGQNDIASLLEEKSDQYKKTQAKAMYQSVQDGQLVDPIEFSKNIDYLHKLFSQEELRIFYRQVKFDESKINESFDYVKYDKLKSVTPLIAVIKSGEYPQAVRALLRAGANPKQAAQYDIETPISMAKRKKRNEITGLLEANLASADKTHQKKEEAGLDRPKRTIKSDYNVDDENKVAKVGENASPTRPD